MQLEHETIYSLLNWLNSTCPSKMAFKCHEKTVTYEELYSRSMNIAKGLTRLDIKKDDKVAIWGSNSIDWILVQMAVAMVGAVLVPINTRHRAMELEYTLKQSDSKFFFIEKEFGISFIDIFREICPEIENAKPGNLKCDEFPELKNVICLGNWQHPGMFAFNELENMGIDNPSPEFSNPEDVVIMQYTSGTTGPAKGVMLSQEQIIKDAFCVSQRMRLTDQDVLLCVMPFGHSGGSILSTILTLVVGASMVIQPYFEPEEAMQMIEKNRCTVLNGLETLYLSILNHPKFEEYDLSPLRAGFATGTPEMLLKIIKELEMWDLCHLFGMSELSPNAVISLPEDSPETRAYTCGKPHEGVEVKIVDTRTGEELPSGEMGEICVRGWNVMQGYYKMPKKTQETIDKDGWLHTGDLGVLREDGYLLFKGRFKDLIRVGGENVSPYEVELLLLSHPSIEMVSVISIPDERLQEVCAAAVKLKPGADVKEDELIEFCKGKMASFKIPKKIFFVNEFPMTESGKVQKFALKEQLIGNE